MRQFTYTSKMDTLKLRRLMHSSSPSLFCLFIILIKRASLASSFQLCMDRYACASPLCQVYWLTELVKDTICFSMIYNGNWYGFLLILSAIERQNIFKFHSSWQSKHFSLSLLHIPSSLTLSFYIPFIFYLFCSLSKWPTFAFFVSYKF